MFLYERCWKNIVDNALSRGILAMHHKTPKVSYCYYNLLTIPLYSNMLFWAPLWLGGLRYCISVQEASLQYLIRIQAASHPAVIGSPVGTSKAAWTVKSRHVLGDGEREIDSYQNVYTSTESWPVTRKAPHPSTTTKPCTSCLKKQEKRRKKCIRTSNVQDFPCAFFKMEPLFKCVWIPAQMPVCILKTVEKATYDNNTTDGSC